MGVEPTLILGVCRVAEMLLPPEPEVVPVPEDEPRPPPPMPPVAVGEVEAGVPCRSYEPKPVEEVEPAGETDELAEERRGLPALRVFLLLLPLLPLFCPPAVLTV